MPFPSPQGTQGLVHAMLSALVGAGHTAELACYGYGSPTPSQFPYEIHRIAPELGLRSLRSGPSLRKLGLDVALSALVRQLYARRRPELVIAHHVEAAAACALARVPFVFVAHTSLETELATYFSPSVVRLVSAFGATLDRLASTRASHVLAVSPLLSELLQSRARVRARVLSLPWPVPASISSEERSAARAQLGFTSEDRVVLYAGNLDGYQGLPVLTCALTQLVRRDARWKWLIATESAMASQSALAPAPWSRLAPLANERDRRLAHAAADVSAVVRASPGGLPIKLLDALARGANVVATRRACAGLALAQVCDVVEDDDPASLAQAFEASLARDRPAANEAARAYVRAAHSDQAFVVSLLAAVGHT